MLMTCTAFSQNISDDVIVLDPVTLTASRTGATEASIPGTVQVIGGEDLSARLQSGEPLDNVLGTLAPGFAPSNGTIGGANQSLRERSPQILIDGGMPMRS